MLPKAWAAFRLATQIWGQDAAADDARAAHEKGMLFPIGAPNDAFARYFIGQSYLAPVSTAQVPIFNVTFEPGCRNNWHTHQATSGGGQLLICINGRGYYQQRGQAARRLAPGDVVNIPAGVEHWHGAAADSWFSHLALEVPGTDGHTDWGAPVTDAEYAQLP